MELQAAYGVFNSDMLPVEVVDVSATVREKFYADGVVRLPAGRPLAGLVADPAPGQPKYLQLTYGPQRLSVLDEAYDRELRLNLRETTPRVVIVYYAYIQRSSNWRAILSGQLLQLKSYGILDEAALHVHVTDTAGTPEEAVALVQELVPQAVLTTSTSNQYEYPGIRLVYDLAHQYPESVLLYFHSKGMSYKVHSRIPDEIALLTHTFGHWRRNLQFFEQEHINKVGLFPAIGDEQYPDTPGTPGGWIWFNFWYARAAYIRRCENPIESPDRHYYESWLGTGTGKPVIANDCQSLRPNKVKTLFKTRESNYYTPGQAGHALYELKSSALSNDFFRY